MLVTILVAIVSGGIIGTWLDSYTAGKNLGSGGLGLGFISGIGSLALGGFIGLVGAHYHNFAVGWAIAAVLFGVFAGFAGFLAGLLVSYHIGARPRQVNTRRKRQQ